jgi:hypothetical protein
MAEELTPDEQEMIAKARNTASKTIEVEDVPATPTTPTSGQAEVDEWGPYDDYHIITPPQGGTFAVPKGQILSFETKTIFSRRENRMIEVQLPTYRDAPKVSV